jgi:hypothetical protein
MARKTFEVEKLRESVNYSLRTSPNWESRARQAIATLLESVLFETGNYKGFRYLESETDENGHLRTDYDPTRREYH